jgi:hypothetical protein
LTYHLRQKKIFWFLFVEFSEANHFAFRMSAIFSRYQNDFCPFGTLETKSSEYPSISFTIYVRLSVRMYQLKKYWTYCHEIVCFGVMIAFNDTDNLLLK